MEKLEVPTPTRLLWLPTQKPLTTHYRYIINSTVASNSLCRLHCLLFSITLYFVNTCATSPWAVRSNSKALGWARDFVDSDLMLYARLHWLQALRSLSTTSLFVRLTLDVCPKSSAPRSAIVLPSSNRRPIHPIRTSLLRLLVGALLRQPLSVPLIFHGYAQ